MLNDYLVKVVISVLYTVSTEQSQTQIRIQLFLIYFGQLFTFKVLLWEVPFIYASNTRNNVFLLILTDKFGQSNKKCIGGSQT